MQLAVLPTRDAIANAPSSESQQLDPAARFACSGCGHCCDQPWATGISEANAAVYDAVDWGATFPQLRNRRLYHRRKIGGKAVLELAKGRGNRCVFLSDDNRCMVHATLGLRAKPQMCQQFPFLPVTTAGVQRVSVNYGCPAVCNDHGPALAEQGDEIRANIAPPALKPQVSTTLALDPQLRFAAPLAIDLIEHLAAEFDPGHTRPLLLRFARGLSLLHTAVCASPAELQSRISAGYFAPDEQTAVDPHDPQSATPAAAPLASRMLLAANLYPDICDPRRSGWVNRFALIPKLMTVTQLRGAYASRLLGKNVSVGDIFSGPPTRELHPAAEALLARYFQARLWQRHALKARGNIVAAFHQHIIDLASIVFFAHTISGEGAPRVFSLDAVQTALQIVEFHIANQERLTDKVLQGWFAAALGDLGVALASLSLVRCRVPAG